MKRTLSIYQYVAPVVLTPACIALWYREYAGDLALLATAVLVPILWAYIVPGIGTNVLRVWEFDTRLRLGRFRPHHGFVFGSATSMIAWVLHSSPARSSLRPRSPPRMRSCLHHFPGRAGAVSSPFRQRTAG